MPSIAVKSYSNNAAAVGASGVIGHYTQLGWADTREVGCGYIKYLDSNGRWTSVSI